MRELIFGVVAFVAMEGVSYLSHRFVMHGFGFGWHRSHHQQRNRCFERNDLYPLFFSTLAVACSVLAAAGVPGCTGIAVGVTAYGVAYAVVHEAYIHRRVPLPLPRTRYFEWTRDAHRLHHLYGGEPYGMLLPVVPQALRVRAAADARCSNLRIRPADEGDAAEAASPPAGPVAPNTTGARPTRQDVSFS